jgi:uncharacterized membrane protein
LNGSSKQIALRSPTISPIAETHRLVEHTSEELHHLAEKSKEELHHLSAATIELAEKGKHVASDALEQVKVTGGQLTQEVFISFEFMAGQDTLCLVLLFQVAD